MTGQLLTTRLSADSLWSRYGFGDGNPFEYEDRGQDFDDAPAHADWVLMRERMTAGQRQDLLALLVHRHLVPAIAAATGETPDLSLVGTHHNPVRAARFDHGNEAEMPSSWIGIDVDVTREQTLAAAREIMEAAA